MARIESYRDLEVWQRAMDLVDEVHRVLPLLPGDEVELRRQLWRAATSIPVNVAEGYRRKSRAAYRNHLSIAFGSLAEVETWLEIAHRNSLLTADRTRDPSALANRVGAMLNRLLDALDG